MTPHRDHLSLLRLALRTNAAFSALSAVALLLASARLAELLGAPRTTLLITGGVLLLFAADLLVTASRDRISTSKALYFVVLDLLWVVGSAILLMLPSPLTATGKVTVLVVAIVVAAFAAAQAHGVRSALCASGPGATAGLGS